jgi:hypothetical protein
MRRIDQSSGGRSSILNETPRLAMFLTASRPYNQFYGYRLKKPGRGRGRIESGHRQGHSWLLPPKDAE